MARTAQTHGAGTEEDLMAAYAAGDKQAFDKLFASLGHRIHGFFWKRFGDGAVADDLLQQTFLKLHRARADYRPGHQVRPWLFTIAGRVAVDEWRRRGRRREVSYEGALEYTGRHVTEHQTAAGDPMEQHDIKKKVRAAIAGLPESQRNVIYLHRYKGMTFGEIADQLGTTEGAAKLRAFRAYGQLRQNLSPLVSVEEGFGTMPPPADAEPSMAVQAA